VYVLVISHRAKHSSACAVLLFGWEGLTEKEEDILFSFIFVLFGFPGSETTVYDSVLKIQAY